MSGWKFIPSRNFKSSSVGFRISTHLRFCRSITRIAFIMKEYGFRGKQVASFCPIPSHGLELGKKRWKSGFAGGKGTCGYAWAPAIHSPRKTTHSYMVSLKISMVEIFGCRYLECRYVYINQGFMPRTV